MSQLISLKRKIKSIETTKKITHAVRLVSMSFYSRLEKQNESLQYHTQAISDSFSHLIPLFADWKNPILFPEDMLNATPLFIIISSAKGLCGSFNANMFRYFEKQLDLEEYQETSFVTIGQKATKFIQEKKLGKIISDYTELTANNFNIITHELTDKIQSTNPPFSSVTFFSNVHKNFFVQKPEKFSLIPFSLENLKKENNSNSLNSEDVIWEQDKIEILNYLAIQYLKSSIFNILFQSLLAENSARFLAMDSSTNNAEKLLEKLVLHFNKSRQTLITQEVSELSVIAAGR